MASYKDIRQDKLKKILFEDSGSLSQAMRKAGYREGYIKSNNIKKTKSFQNMKKDLLTTLEEKEAMLLAGITEAKIKKEPATRLSSAVKDINHVKQLVSGKATDNVKFIIEREEG